MELNIYKLELGTFVDQELQTILMVANVQMVLYRIHVKMDH